MCQECISVINEARLVSKEDLDNVINHVWNTIGKVESIAGARMADSRLMYGELVSMRIKRFGIAA